MIAALQNARQGAPSSSSGPAAGPAAPSAPAVDPMMAEMHAKLDQILALLSPKEDDAESLPNPQEKSDNGNSDD